EYRSRARDIRNAIITYNEEMAALTEKLNNAETYEELLKLYDEMSAVYTNYKELLKELHDLAAPDEYSSEQTEIAAALDTLLELLDKTLGYIQIARDFVESFYILLDKHYDTFSQIYTDITDTAMDNINNIYESDKDGELRKAYFKDIFTDVSNIRSIVEQCNDGIYFDDAQFKEKFIGMLDNGIVACGEVAGRTPPEYFKNQHSALCTASENLKKDFENIRSLYLSLDGMREDSEAASHITEQLNNAHFDEILNEIIGQES
ncbi:MAG: hypothetical protein IK093_19075, partial [Ruminiclostridium sp.]|nr:hypothetical protein [Ruminiclostridium sp.]